VIALSLSTAMEKNLAYSSEEEKKEKEGKKFRKKRNPC